MLAPAVEALLAVEGLLHARADVALQREQLGLWPRASLPLSANLHLNALTNGYESYVYLSTFSGDGHLMTDSPTVSWASAGLSGSSPRVRSHSRFRKEVPIILVNIV